MMEMIQEQGSNYITKTIMEKYYIVEIKNQNRKWIVLEVTDKDLKR